MLNKPPKLSKKVKKRMYEEYIEVQRVKLRFESKVNDQSVSSWDFVHYMMKYKKKD